MKSDRSLELDRAVLIDLPWKAIIELCRQHRVRELSVFGSVLRQDFRSESDIDFLVDFEAGAEKPWMGHYLALEDDLSHLLKRRVDLVSKRAVEESANWIRRKSILESARLLYAA